MKKFVLFIAALSMAFSLFAQADSAKVAATSKKDIIKTGWNLGPLPAIAYDADKGFQLGAIIQLFNYGDGSNYPNYDRKWYAEASFFTKGSMLFQVRYDDKELIPGVRWSSTARVNLDKAFDFYGFNGYQSYYDFARIQAGKDGSNFRFTPFYRYQRNEVLFKSDFIGKITDNLRWEAGIFANYFNLATIDYDNINRKKEGTDIYPESVLTLYDVYKISGVISEEEADGGFTSGVRAGLVYDTRNKEGAPSRGIWAEAHVVAAPKFLSESQYYRYSATWRHYLPIVKNDILTFAYRLNYEGTFGSSAPFYVLPYMTVMGERNDLEGMGGYNTVRGIMRTRAYGLDMATYNAEFRWRFTKFHIGKQNIALGLNAFSDGTMVTRGYDISKLPEEILIATLDYGFETVKIRNAEKDAPHITFGAGFRFIMNENFIVAAEYGMPVSHLVKSTNPIYNQDGNGAFYVNIGYLF